MATAEPDEHPDFCTLAKKVFRGPDFRFDVVVRHHRAESYIFLSAGRAGDLAGLALFFALYKFETAVIQDAAHGRGLVGTDLYEVETFILRHIEGVTQ